VSAREIADRRQRAREAFWDGTADSSSLGNDHPFLRALGNCVEVATQVKITDEAVATTGLPDVAARAVIGAALAALGFEVIE